MLHKFLYVIKLPIIIIRDERSRHLLNVSFFFACLRANIEKCIYSGRSILTSSLINKLGRRESSPENNEPRRLDGPDPKIMSLVEAVVREERGEKNCIRYLSLKIIMIKMSLNIIRCWWLCSSELSTKGTRRILR